MILPDCNFFPGTPLPLYIFEPKYRAMLEFALQHERMFCIGTRVGATALPKDDEAGIYRHGVLGLIRACVRNEDGTSQLLLDGLCRVVFGEWRRENPFLVGAIRPLPTEVDDESKVLAASNTLHELALKMCRVNLAIPSHIRKQFEEDWNPELLADLVAYYLIDDVHTRHALLAMEELRDRISFVTERLRGQLAQFPES